jgi:hypothetical protein
MMRGMIFMPVLALLALPAAAGAQGRAEAGAEVHGDVRVQVATESLARQRRGGKRVEPTVAEREAGARALAAGATRAELARIRDAAPDGRDMTASLSALAELRAAGMSGGRAASQIASRLRSGATDRAITTYAADATAALELRGSGGVGSATSGLGAGLGVAGSLGGMLR